MRQSAAGGALFGAPPFYARKAGKTFPAVYKGWEKEYASLCLRG